MRRKNLVILDTRAILLAALLPAAGCMSAKPLVLSETGSTTYSVVIAREAVKSEEYAAGDLTHFLKQITGAEFPVRRDDEPASDFEVVIGNTNRASINDLPEHLRTDIPEGFALYRSGPKLHIMGNIPRATLYGVYDFLDVDLGVRFLTAEVTHIPKASTLKIPMRSRSFAPPMEYRTIWEVLGGSSILRNRMNGQAFGIVSEKMLGGVKIIGPPVHSFNSLVPVDEYFDEHPEYFSLIDGTRVREYDGKITQLCLTNPDVDRISLERIRGWLGPAVEANPYNKYLVNVTVNDSNNYCECEACVAVN